MINNMKNTANQHLQPITTKVNNENHLEIGGCDLVNLAQEYKTPLYIIDEETLRSICKDYKRAFETYENTVQFLYASKALCTKAIFKIISQEDFGCDIVSEGELYTALSAGMNPEKILFNGNNKGYEELEYAVKSNIGRFSVDNFLELSNLNEIAEKENKVVNIFIRITPGIDCWTHDYIKTGKIDSKFGFNMSEIDTVIELLQNKHKNLKLRGLHAHIGSQIFETECFKDEVEILIKQYVRLREKYSLDFDEINLGGGYGIKYTEDDTPLSLFDLGEVVISAMNENCEKYGIKKPKIYLEPGRSTICTSGVTIYKIGNIKHIPNVRTYVAVDGGMTDNIRPALYGAKYTAVLANKMNSDEELKKVRVVGKLCESGDILIDEIELPNPQKDDILCVFNTGAYNYSMSSNYNRVKKPAMILVNNSQSDIIINRETLEDLTRNDIIPRRFES